MSDESGEKKPRLQLSRDLKQPEPASSQNEDKDNALEGTPRLKPKLKQPTATPPTQAVPPATPVAPTTFDPRKPFNDALPPQREEEQPAGQHRNPPELPSKPAPQIHDGSGAKLEESIERLEKETHPNNTLTSILIVAVLLLILAAAGGGIWWVLKSPAETKTAPPAPTSAITHAAPVKSKISTPITKAKAAIDSVPVAEVPELDTNSDASPVATAPPPEPAPTPTADKTAPIPEEETAPPAPAATDLRDTVSTYLANVHIGGVRNGVRAKVMIDGESYEIGDLIDENTGLKFAGTRDGRLLFKDRNGILYVKSF